MDRVAGVMTWYICTTKHMADDQFQTMYLALCEAILLILLFVMGVCIANIAVVFIDFVASVLQYFESISDDSGGE